MALARSHLTRAAVYTRVSSEKQGRDEDKASIGVQLAECRTHCEHRGYTAIAEYVDERKYRSRGRMVEPSGTRSDRPGWLAMLASARAGEFDVLVAFNTSRLYRGMRPAIELRELMDATGLVVDLVRERFDPKSQYIMASVSAMFRDAIVENTALGLTDRVERGLFRNGPLPLGWVAAGATNYRLGPGWREQFDAMARLFLAGHSYGAVADLLGARPDGYRWIDTRVHSVLHHPFNFGLVYERRHRPDALFRPGPHGGAWDEATSAAIVVERERRHRLGRRTPRSRSALFTGVLRCGICGRVMTATGFTPSSGAQRYRCSRTQLRRQGYLTGATHPMNNASEFALLDNLWELMRGLDPGAVEAFLAEAASSTTQPDEALREHLTAQIGNLNAKLSELELAASMQLPPAALQAITDDVKVTDRRLRQAQTELARQAVPDAPDTAVLLAEFEALKREDWREYDRPSLRALIHATFPALYVDHGRFVAPVAEWV